MNISDEMLSAFLDDELPENDMAAVRDAICLDASLAGRLARLASTDGAVKRYASAIDAVPMPEAVLDLLRTEPANAGKGSKVTVLAHWRQARQKWHEVLREHATLAAGIALVLGVSGGLLLDNNSSGSAALSAGLVLAPAASAALDSTLSGQTVDIGDHTFLARFSFVDTQSRFCRQFRIEDIDNGSEHLACHNGADWELLASARASGVYRTQDYQTASSSVLLDSTLNVLMRDPALSLTEEAALIQSHWSRRTGE
jgi:hypothetical protein